VARLSREEWESLEADYHTGEYSKNELALKYGISHTAVNKRLKGVEPKNKDKVSALISIKTDLFRQSFKNRNAVETIVEEKTKHLLYFQNASLKNQELANNALYALEKTLNSIDNEQERDAIAMKSITILKEHANITKINKEAVLGKEPETVINNTNQQTINKIEREIID